MLLFKKKIIVTIGYNGAIIAFHDTKSVSKKFFFEKFNIDAINKIKPYFVDYSRANISILLDTIDQTYKKKTFPSVRKMDLKNIVIRELGGASNKETIKNFITKSLVKEKTKDGKQITKKWDVVLVTASLNNEVSSWIDFLFEMPNMIEGIYTIPVESFNIVKQIRKKLRLETQAKKKKASIKNEKEESVTCLVFYTKINGFRQVIFTKQGIEFTRIVNYDIDDKDFLKNYEQDIYSSYEYLKRSISDVNISDVKIINVVPANIVKKLKEINNSELHIISYTPCEISRILGLNESIIPKSSEFCDILLSRLLFKFKPILRFRIPKMITTSKMYMMMMGSYYLYLFLIIFFFVEFLININIRLDFDQKIEAAEIAMFKSTEHLHDIQNKVLNTTNEEGKNINIAQAIDIGKVNDVLGEKSNHVFDIYQKLDYIKKHNIVISKFNYFLQGYNELNPGKDSKFSMSLFGKIFNATGNVDDLFNEFDDLDRDTKENLEEYVSKFSKIPRNIDFNKKYYDFPLDFTISPK
ncbi:MAG: hypothetical protein ISQ34_03790 [Rickettsiales bacterium]|nr:hypothetical protein [Rickettsiales bacterium]